MSRILWINPLGTSVFDATIGAELRRVKRPTTEVEVRSLKRGPHHLEYHAYEAWVTPDVLTAVVVAEREGFDAAVIGCFYDTGLRPAREVATRIAVAAPCESAIHIASTLGDSFSVIVGRRKWVPEMRDNVTRYGYRDRLASFRVVELGVHDFQHNPDLTRERLTGAAHEAVTKDGAEVVVLGCTAEYGFFESLQAQLGVPVVDATVAPFKYAELLADLAELGWRPSKIGGYATPSREELEAFGLAAQLATSPLAETVANPGR
jgi:Asp/Glu/hydantoin racemase